MGAYVEHDFKKGFLLDESRVRKLHEIVAERAAKIPTPAMVVFKVFRGDSFSYETSDVNDVINEDNNDWRAITRLDVKVDAKDVLEFTLTFSQKASLLRIVGDDRDIVFLLYSDVRDYVSKEILSRRKLTQDTSRTIGAVLMLTATIGMIWGLYSNMMPSGELASAAIESNDIGEKLNFLIKEKEDSKRQFGPIGGLALMTLAMLLTVTGLLEYTWKMIFPTNLFLFGKRKDDFERRRKFLANVFWVIVVGTLVSVGAGFVVWWATTA